MKLISSRSTFIQKRVFPTVWFGGLGVVASLALLSILRCRGPASLPFLLLPAGMAAIGYLFMKALVFDLMDQVWDAGDSLVVRNKDAEEHILLTDIMNVSYTVWMNPNRVTLTLRRPCRWGKDVSFMPPVSFVPFRKSPLVLDLIERIDAKRRSS